MKLFSTLDRGGPPSRGRALGAAVEAGLLLFLLTWLGGCSPRKADSQGAGMMAVPVTVASVMLKTVPVELHAIGNGEAYSTINVKSQVDGQLEDVYFTEGQDVKKGDLIFKIDTRPFEAVLHQAEANLARDMAQEKNAEAQQERGKKLFDAGIASKEQFDQLLSNAAALAATVRADRAAAENAKIQLDYCSIYSPLDGRTGTLMVHPGNIVKANDAALVVINQISPLYVDFTVPERYLPDIKRYLARGSLRVQANVPNDQGPAEEGTISFVNNTVDSSTGTILLKATFPNTHKRLWPGQFINVVVTLTSVHDAVVVPNQAVQTGQAGQYVFVLKDDHSVEPRPVVAGSVWGTDEVVEKGLRAGETVVTDGQLLLYPGARVEVKNAASEVPSPAPGSTRKPGN